jgi:hypothetical protein
MKKEDKIFEYSKKLYTEIYNREYQRLEDRIKESSKSNRIPTGKHKEIENAAQLEAIKCTMIEGRKQFPNDIPLLWNSIYRVHLFRKSGISDIAVLNNAIAAAQSWKASSGHAFEYMTKELANLVLADTPIKFLLQKDLSTLLKAKELANDPRDIAWLEKQVGVDNFDLYVVAEKDEQTYCFGCVQCKTSIRDRVSRDRELSSEAMQAFFWSISMVLDGTQLKTPKYIAMVNGGQDTFSDNGWHGMYDLSGTIPCNRIYALDVDFTILKDHALQAYKAWSEQRQWFTKDWMAK